MAGQWLRKLSGLALCLSFMGVQGVASLSAQEADSNQSETNLPEIKLVDALFANRNGMAGVDGNIRLTFSFSNLSNTDLSFQPGKFAVLCEDEKFSCRFTFSKKEVSLVPGQKIEVVMSARIKSDVRTEPDLALVYESSDYKYDLNAAFRSMDAFQVKRCGPDDLLAIIETNLNVCPVLVWVLQDQLPEWKRQGIQRIVLDVNGTRDRSSDYSLNSVESWLAAIRVDHQSARPQGQATIRPEVHFDQFFVAVKNGYTPRRAFSPYSSRPSIPVFQRNRTEAIVAALKDVYETVSMETVISDLQHEELGLRTLAIAQHIDRMSSEQLKQLMSTTDEKDSSMAILLASNLHRVALPEGVIQLQQFVRSENKAVSKAALTSMIKSASPIAEDCIRDLWQAPTDNVSQERIVEAILANKTSTHTELLEEYAIALLKDFASEQAVKPSSAALLARLLANLQANGRQDILPIAEKNVLKISNLTVQDQVMSFLASQPQGSGALSLVREYVRQRMVNIQQAVDECLADAEPDQPKWKKASGLTLKMERELGVSQSFLTQVQRVPDSAFTEALGIIASSQMSSSTRERALITAIKCANDEQLSELAESFETIGKNSRPILLKALAELQHPDFLPLLELCLTGDNSENVRTLSSFLNQNPPQSQEILLVIVRRLNEVLNEQNAWYEEQAKQKNDDKDKDEDDNFRRLTQKQRLLISPIIKHLCQYDHPEVLRALNRCERSAYEEVHQMIDKNSRRSRMLELHIDALKQAYELRQKEDYKAAREVYNQLLERNPLYSAAYASRSSLHLRLGEPEKARADLKRSLELDPENATNESLAALAEIQLGNVEEGLQELKRINNSLPDIPTEVKTNAIYNLACGYGRAIEKETSEDTIARYEKLGIEALRKSIERDNGFDDEQHLLLDPDLNAFHSHPDWDELREKARANQP